MRLDERVVGVGVAQGAVHLVVQHDAVDAARHDVDDLEVARLAVEEQVDARERHSGVATGGHKRQLLHCGRQAKERAEAAVALVLGHDLLHDGAHDLGRVLERLELVLVVDDGVGRVAQAFSLGVDRGMAQVGVGGLASGDVAVHVAHELEVLLLIGTRFFLCHGGSFRGGESVEVVGGPRALGIGSTPKYQYSHWVTRDTTGDVDNRPSEGFVRFRGVLGTGTTLSCGARAVARAVTLL